MQSHFEQPLFFEECQGPHLEYHLIKSVDYVGRYTDGNSVTWIFKRCANSIWINSISSSSKRCRKSTLTVCCAYWINESKYRIRILFICPSTRVTWTTDKTQCVSTARLSGMTKYSNWKNVSLDMFFDHFNTSCRSLGGNEEKRLMSCGVDKKHRLVKGKSRRHC